MIQPYAHALIFNQMQYSAILRMFSSPSQSQVRSRPESDYVTIRGASITCSTLAMHCRRSHLR